MRNGVVLYTVPTDELSGYHQVLWKQFGIECAVARAELDGRTVFQFTIPGAEAAFFPGGVVKIRRYRCRTWPRVFDPHQVISIHNLKGHRLELNHHYCLKCGHFVNGSSSSESIEVRTGLDLERSISHYQCRCGHEWKVVGR